MSSQDHLPQPATERDPITGHRSLATAGNLFSGILKTYFRSGWAFFIPYLAAYLLYAWLRWPVNPVTGDTPPATDSVHLSPFSLLLPPSLLHVYWVLHAVHLVLGVFALRAWWRQTSLLHSPFSLLLKAAPWLLLALLFYIPGIYLEWPSDPWEHLRRINEWSVQSQIQLHSSASKSAYFLYYSFVSVFPISCKLSVIKLVSVSLLLILISQFWRLAKQVGLTRRMAWVATLLWLLTFGNTAFSFFRYYGISSTIVSQIGVLALLRMAIPVLTREHGATSLPPGSSRPSSAVQTFTFTSLLLLLIALNHIQGVAIVSLGILGVLAWRLSYLKPPVIAVVVAAMILLNVFVVLLWWRSPTEEWLVLEGWISSVRTFELSSLDSPAVRQASKILGALGVIDLICALCLLGKNRLIPWLTITPIIVLVMPVTCLVLVAFLPIQAPELVTIFGRLLFAIPYGLSTVAFAAHVVHQTRRSWLPLALLLSLITSILCGGALSPVNERVWHLLSVPAQDLQMVDIGLVADNLTNRPSPSSRIIATNEIQFILNAYYPKRFAFTERKLHTPPAISFQSTYDILTRLDESTGNNPSARTIRLGRRSDWVTVTGHEPHFLGEENSESKPTVVFQSRPDLMSQVFSREYYLVRSEERYAIEFIVRRIGAGEATAYLAVAWYDENLRLLPANSNPFESQLRGWANGTYSYFGLVDGIPPLQWTLFRVVFGNNEPVNIPPAAKYFRIGCILNLRSAPNAAIQMSDSRLVRLQKHERIAAGIFPDAEPCAFITRAHHALLSPNSQAAQLAGHWQSQTVAYTTGAGTELLAKLRGLPDLQHETIESAPGLTQQVWFWRNHIHPAALK